MVKMEPKKIFVTGAGGFIGSYVCRQFKSEGHYVVGLGRRSAPSGCDQVLVGDVTDPAPWESALKGVDTVVHLAGKAHAHSESRSKDAEYFRVNTAGTKSVLEAARRAGIERFVYFSSVKAMVEQSPESDGVVGELDEGATALPVTPYGKSKLEAEKLVLAGNIVREGVVLRPCAVYGIGAKGNLTRMLAAVSRGRFPGIPFTGNKRSMVHVDDLARATLAAATHPNAAGEIFIVSDGQAYSAFEIYEIMCRALGKAQSRWRVPLWLLKTASKAGDQAEKMTGRRMGFDSNVYTALFGSAWFSSGKICRQLAFQPEWDLKRAMPHMVRALNASARLWCMDRE